MRRLARRLSVACLAVVLLLGMAAVSWNRAQDSGLSSSAPVTPPPPTAFLAIDVDSVDAAALDAAVVAGIIPAGAFQSPSTPEPQPTAVPSRKARGPVAGSVLALEPLAPDRFQVAGPGQFFQLSQVLFDIIFFVMGPLVGQQEAS